MKHTLQRAIGRLGRLLGVGWGAEERPLPPNVDFERGFVFVHAPRTAGAAMCQALSLPAPSNHDTAEDFRRMLGRRYGELFSFAFVRNPWDRFVSQYNHARMSESHFHSAIRPEKAVFGIHRDYQLLKDASLRQCADLLLAGKLGKGLRLSYWLPQHNWVCGTGGEVIVDFLGRFETRDSDFDKIAARLGVSPVLPDINRSEPRGINYRDVFDAETREIVRSYYSRDIELFGYEF